MFENDLWFSSFTFKFSKMVNSIFWFLFKTSFDNKPMNETIVVQTFSRFYKCNQLKEDDW